MRSDKRFRKVFIGPDDLTFNQFENIATNLVRRQFPQLLATNVVGVQPLSRPVGLAYAMRFAENPETLFRYISIGDEYEVDTWNF